MFGMLAHRMNHRLDSRPLLIATGQQSSPRRRTHGARGMKIGQPHTLGGQPVNLRRLEIGIAKTTHAGIPHIVDHDDDEVGARFGVGQRCGKDQ